MMNNTIYDLHSAWCQHSGQELNLRATERIFYELNLAGFNADDIRCVVTGMKRHNANNSAKYKILCHKVCGDLEYFASLLADYRAKERNHIPKPTPKQQVIQQFSPVVVEQITGGTATTPAQIKFIQAIKTII